MKSVDDYMDENRIKEVAVDRGKARSLAKRSQKRLQTASDRTVTETNAFQILENVYEAIREIIEAAMALEGYLSRDHVATIAWAAENLDLKRTTANRLHKFRKLRNASRYEAEEITPEQAYDIISFAELFIGDLADRLEQQLQQPP